MVAGVVYTTQCFLVTYTDLTYDATLLLSTASNSSGSSGGITTNKESLRPYQQIISKLGIVFSALSKSLLECHSLSEESQLLGLFHILNLQVPSSSSSSSSYEHKQQNYNTPLFKRSISTASSISETTTIPLLSMSLPEVACMRIIVTTTYLLTSTSTSETCIATGDNNNNNSGSNSNTLISYHMQYLYDHLCTLSLACLTQIIVSEIIDWLKEDINQASETDKININQVSETERIKSIDTTDTDMLIDDIHLSDSKDSTNIHTKEGTTADVYQNVDFMTLLINYITDFIISSSSSSTYPTHTISSNNNEEEFPDNIQSNNTSDKSTNILSESQLSVSLLPSHILHITTSGLFQLKNQFRVLRIIDKWRYMLHTIVLLLECSLGISSINKTTTAASNNNNNSNQYTTIITSVINLTNTTTNNSEDMKDNNNSNMIPTILLEILGLTELFPNNNTNNTKTTTNQTTNITSSSSSSSSDLSVLHTEIIQQMITPWLVEYINYVKLQHPPSLILHTTNPTSNNNEDDDNSMEEVNDIDMKLVRISSKCHSPSNKIASITSTSNTNTNTDVNNNNLQNKKQKLVELTNNNNNNNNNNTNNNNLATKNALVHYTHLFDHLPAGLLTTTYIQTVPKLLSLPSSYTQLHGMVRVICIRYVYMYYLLYMRLCKYK